VAQNFLASNKAAMAPVPTAATDLTTQPANIPCFRFHVAVDGTPQARMH
jgi:hypothetical protein